MKCKYINKLLIISAILLTALSALVISSCSKIDDLSDYNEIRDFEIISYHPIAMELSEVQIEESIIYIGVSFGEYLFPMHFMAKPIFNGEIDRITGLDFSKELVLENTESELTFYVMASSGLSRPYTIKSRVKQLNKNISISRFFTIKEPIPNMLVSEEGMVVNYSEEGIRRDTLKIFSVNGTYPVTIIPEFAIHTTSQFGSITGPDNSVQLFDNGNTPLLFESTESAYKIEVISESGLKNEWTVVMCHAPFVSGNDGISTAEQRERSDIDPRTVSAVLSGSAVFSIDESIIDNMGENILLMLTEDGGSISFPLKVEIDFDLSDGVQLFELEQPAILTFESWDDIIEFYILDTDACVSRLWRIGLKERKTSGNDVLSFGYNYTAATVTYKYSLFSPSRGPSITLDNTKTAIYPSTGDIYLYMNHVNNVDVVILLNPDNWKLTLNNLKVVVSEGATVSLPSFVWSGNDSWMSSIPFTVTAQDGKKKTWRVNIRDMRTPTLSSACELFGLNIARYSPNYAAFDAFEPVVIDNDKQCVTLKLIDDNGVYPLSIWPLYETSPFSGVTSQSGGNDPLLFDSPDSEQTITVTAEDGTKKVWSVKLQAPTREVQANVESFQVTSVSQGALLGKVTKKDETGLIRLWLDAAVTFPLEISYVMTVSKKATASVPLRGTFKANSYKDLLSFSVTAQDGSKRDWNAKLVYEPQLPNWTFDSWSNSEPVGWGTSNKASTGTTPTVGNPGSAAQLRTGSTLGNIASGSLFLGEFNKKNRPITDGLSDPISLTFFGKPLETSGKVLGIQMDVIYSPGSMYISGTNRELGSCVVELVKPKAGQENAEFIYHGADASGVQHKANTAYSVAHAQVLFGNSPGTSWKGTDITVVSNTQWTTVQVLFNYPDGKMPDFTHLHIVFASSGQGDIFKGVSGSTLKVDNVKILYEEE